MDITAIAATSRSAVPESVLFDQNTTQRPLVVQLSPAARAEISISASHAGAAPSSSPAGALCQTIDRIRAEFDLMRHRLFAPAAHSTHASTSAAASPAVQLEAVMNQSMKIQTGIFQIAVSFQAGLTASQQSQSGVKTLIEKS